VMAHPLRPARRGGRATGFRRGVALATPANYETKGGCCTVWWCRGGAVGVRLIGSDNSSNLYRLLPITLSTIIDVNLIIVIIDFYPSHNLYRNVPVILFTINMQPPQSRIVFSCTYLSLK
jgi:hypothetical protein